VLCPGRAGPWLIRAWGPELGCEGQIDRPGLRSLLLSPDSHLCVCGESPKCKKDSFEQPRAGKGGETTLGFLTQPAQGEPLEAGGSRV
jgi:hypothetical protein